MTVGGVSEPVPLRNMRMRPPVFRNAWSFTSSFTSMRTAPRVHAHDDRTGEYRGRLLEASHCPINGFVGLENLDQLGDHEYALDLLRDIGETHLTPLILHGSHGRNE